MPLRIPQSRLDDLEVADIAQQVVDVRIRIRRGDAGDGHGGRLGAIGRLGGEKVDDRFDGRVVSSQLGSRKMVVLVV